MAKSWRKKIKNDILYVLIRVIVLVIQLLPRPMAFSVASILGRLAFFILRSDRRRTIDHLSLAFSNEKSTTEIMRLAQQTFVDLAQNAVDAIQLRFLDKQKIEALVNVSGMEHFVEAYRKQHGLIAVTGHIGCFELIAAYFSYQGYPCNVISRSLYDRRLDRLLVKNREQHGVKDIHRGWGIRELLRVLRNGEVLGILSDQDTRVEGVFVSFFGKKAHTPAGPAAMAIQRRAALVPMAIYRNHQTQTYQIEVHPQIPFPNTGDKHQKIIWMTQEYTRILENIIREHPTQWVWMHRRWKKRPPENLSL